MSKKFKSQASSARAASATLGNSSFGFGSTSSGFQTSSSLLSYVTETPDLAGISEPRVVVAFKNLTKKDSVTKSKGLEELQLYVTSIQSEGSVLEESFIETWTSIYPRLSIENARRVRQLAHILQGSLTVFTGKRIAPHLPKVIGPWLAGLFDSDKSVSKAARDSLESSFATEEKRENAWSIYQANIIGFVEDATILQTPQTLSDERTVSPDDAEAKHCRLVGTSVLTLDRLIAVIEKKKNGNRADVNKLLNAEKLWDYVHHVDSFPRRGVCTLLQTCLLLELNSLDWAMISTCFLAKALHVSHVGSSLLYADTIVKISEARPTVWTTEYLAKTSSSKRLFQFLKHGSQRGSERFWVCINHLLRRIPETVWSHGSKPSEADPSVTAEGVVTLLEALHGGIINPEEPRSNALTAWSTYTETAFWAIQKLKSDDEAHLAIDKHIFPLIKQFVNNSSEQIKWTIPGKSASNTCGKCLSQLFEICQAGVDDLLKEMTSQLLDRMKLSLPEQSKDFRSSQDAIISHSRRYFALLSSTRQAVGEVEDFDRSSIATLEENVAILIQGAMQLLRDRNYKPYGAAGLIELSARETPALVFSSRQQQVKQELSEFLSENVSDFLESPSTDLIVSIALACDDKPDFENCLLPIVKVLLSSETGRTSSALRQIVKNIDATKLRCHPGLKKHVSESIDSALKGETTKWDDLQHLIGARGELSDTANQMLSSILDGVHLQETQEGAFIGIESLLRHGASLFSGASQSSQLKNLVLELQDLSYVDDEAADRAASLNKQLKEQIALSGSNAMCRVLSPLVHEQLSHCDAKSASARALADLAIEIIQYAPGADRLETVSSVFPSEQLWAQALSDFVDYGPYASNAITSPIEGAVYFIPRVSFEKSRIRAARENRDSSTFCPLARLTYYVIKLLRYSNFLNELELQTRHALFLYLPQAVQLLDNKLNDPDSNEAWSDLSPAVESEIAEHVSEGRVLIKRWILEQAEAGSPDAVTIESCWLEQLENLGSISASTYNRGIVSVNVMSECISVAGVFKYSTMWESRLKTVRSSPNLVQSACLVVLCKDWLASSPLGQRLCNELIAGSMDSYESDQESVTRQLCLFNLLVSENDANLHTIPQHRLVMLVKHLLGALHVHYGAAGLCAEMLKAIYHMVPLIEDVFGEHWQKILEEVSKCISDANGPQRTLPSLNIALRLLLRLKSCTGKDGNEDLEEAWEEMLPSFSRALIESLQNNNTFVSEIEDQSLEKSRQPHGEARSKPRLITLDLIARLVRKLEIFDNDNSTNLFPLLAAEDKAIQDAGFDILHRSIPQNQEKITFDVALSKTTVHLPEELLSLLLDAPDGETLISLDQSMDAVFLGARRYLLSWKMVFDHFKNASHQVQEMYVEDLKESEHLSRFLDLAVEVLKINAKSIDASKFDITKFEIDDFIAAEREIAWLVIHLYYLSLQYLSSLTRVWWINSRNRVKLPLESWTDKYITPLITSSAVEGVTNWAATLDQSEERPLQVKVSPNRSELVASIVIDEENPAISIAISLPRAYPFQSANVSSRHRVGVDEKKWQSWLRTIQIIILTSNSLIDGLLAFRRNVLGALKGQTECAICYSVIGQDMKPPDKPCKTCKNNFHSICLFRWFKSSSSSTCPLCRNNFNYA